MKSQFTTCKLENNYVLQVHKKENFDSKPGQVELA